MLCFPSPIKLPSSLNAGGFNGRCWAVHDEIYHLMKSIRVITFDAWYALKRVSHVIDVAWSIVSDRATEYKYHDVVSADVISLPYEIILLAWNVSALIFLFWRPRFWFEDKQGLIFHQVINDKSLLASHTIIIFAFAQGYIVPRRRALETALFIYISRVAIYSSQFQREQMTVAYEISAVSQATNKKWNEAYRNSYAIARDLLSFKLFIGLSVFIITGIDTFIAHEKYLFLHIDDGRALRFHYVEMKYHHLSAYARRLSSK